LRRFFRATDQTVQFRDDEGGIMLRRTIWTLVAACVLAIFCAGQTQAQQPRSFGNAAGGVYGSADWERFYHYPYVYYPHNFAGPEYYQSRNSLYYRYPQEMRVPVYNKKWHNFYPSPRRYHWGHQFITDVF
jgi:hypothetical protein